MTTEHKAQSHLAEEDPDVHRTLRWYWDPDRYEFPRLSALQRVQLERQNWAELRRHLRAFRPDVVAWWSMGCMSLTLIEQVRRRGIPAIFIVHDDWLVYGWKHDAWTRIWRGRRRALAPAAERLCGVPTAVDVCAAGPLVFNSRYTLGRAKAAGIYSSTASVVHPGIDERFLDPLPASPWRWRLVYVGRIDRQKGIDTAVEALSHLPPTATLTVWGVGDDRYATEMRTLAEKFGVGARLCFNGFASGDALRSAYADADVVIFPVRWEEPFGLVPLEAMGLGRPVVTTARGGTSEYVQDGVNALVVPSDDPAAIASCVGRLARDEGLRARIRAGGRRTAGWYTAERFAKRTVEAITRAAFERSDVVAARQ
jgi:glycosyltransferase involved in cell wall biosynthesis